MRTMKHTTTKRKGFVLNLRSRVMHRLPSQEQCNVDAVARVDRLYYKTISGLSNFKRCGYCFRRSE